MTEFVDRRASRTVTHVHLGACYVVMFPFVDDLGLPGFEAVQLIMRAETRDWFLVSPLQRTPETRVVEWIEESSGLRGGWRRCS